jgi:hypothetical protein
MPDKAKIRRQRNLRRSAHRQERMREASRILWTHRLFRHWLAANRDRLPFAITPHHHEAAGLASYTLEGICPRVHLLLDFGGSESMVTYDESEDPRELWSIARTIAYIADPRFDPGKGYYDADRIDGIYTYFPTEEAFVIGELFEPIVGYLTETFRPGVCLCTHKGLGSFSVTLTRPGEERPVDRWGVQLFFGTIVGDDEAVEWIRRHGEPYTRCYALFGGGPCPQSSTDKE